MIDFDSVQAALEQLDATADAAESHGSLCALLLDGSTLSSWLAHTLEELPEPGNVLATEHLAVLRQLYETSREQLGDDELAFELLLPDESEDFDLRLIAISTWCQGFLYGLGVTGAATSEALDDVGRECLSDLLEISKLSHDEEGSDEAELQYAELVEHVRMATLLLQEMLNPLKASSTVH